MPIVSDSNLKSILNHISESVLLIDKEGIIMSFNDNSKTDVFNNTDKELRIGGNVYDFIEDSRKGSFKKIITKVLSGKSVQYDQEYNRSLGEKVWFQFSLNPVYEDSLVTGICITGRDVTSSKDAEEKTKKSEQDYRYLFENNPLPLWIYDLETYKFLEVNKAAIWLYGYTRDEFLSMSLYDVRTEDSYDLLKSQVEKVKANNAFSSGTWEHLKKNGEVLVVEISGMSIDYNNKKARLILLNDITQSAKQAAEINRIKTDKEALINGTEDLIWSVDSRLCIITANNAYLQMIKMITDKIPKEGDAVLLKEFGEGQYNKWSAYYQRALNGERFSVKEQIYNLVKQSTAHRLISFNPMYNHDGKIYGAACYAKDITAETLNLSALESAKDELDKIMNSSLDIICTIDEAGNFKKVNYSAEKIWGYSINEIIGKPYISFVYEKDVENTNKAALQIMEGEDTTDFENRYVKKDGSLVHISWSVKWDDNDKLMYCVARDITEKKKTDKKIEESEKRFRQIVETAQEGIWIINVDNQTTFVNKKMCEILEYTEEEMLGRTNISFRDEEEQKIALQNIERRKKGIKETHETKYLTKTGRNIWAQVSTNPLLDDNGNYAGALAMVTDITERKKAELKIKESHDRFINVSKATFDAIWDWDVKTKQLFLGDRFKDIFGYQVENNIWSFSSWASHIHPEDWERVITNRLNKIINHEEVNWEDDYRYLRADGSTAYVLDRGILLRNITGTYRMIGAMQDVTRRRINEFALQQSESRLQAIITSQTNYVIRTDLEGHYTYYNQKFVDEYGWVHNKQNLIGMNSLSTIMEYDHQHVIDTVKKCFIKMNEVIQIEIDKPAKDGGIRTTLWDFICLTDSNNRPTEIQCVGIDISDRKKAEIDFINSLEEKNIILESIDDGFFAVDKNWKITYWNKQAENMLQMPREKVLGKIFWEVYPYTTDSDVFKNYQMVMEGKDVEPFENFSESDKHWFEISPYPSEKGITVYFKNISARKLSEIKLNELNTNLQKQAKQLAVSNDELERFAYVTSHDLQEPLRMVTSFLQLLQKKYDAQLDDTAQKYINFAVDGASRMKTLILDLLEFSRISSFVEDHTIINLNNAITKTLLLLKPAIDEAGAVINISDLAPVCGNESQLMQLFQNLISNGIKYRNQQNPVIDISSLETPDEWEFYIKDNGIGIDEKFYDKIFIIFQRLHNRKEYEGTGIGLAICKKIVELHGGKIWVESVPGKGSKFCFTIKKLQISNEMDSHTLCPDIKEKS